MLSRIKNLIDRWNERSEEMILNALDKTWHEATHIKKPIKIYCLLSEIYYILDGHGTIKTSDLNCDIFNGHYLVKMPDYPRYEITKLDTKAYAFDTGYKFEYYTDVFITFEIIVTKDKVEIIHNENKTAEEISSIIQSNLDKLQEFKQYVDDKVARENKQKQFNYKQERKLEETC